MRYTWLWLLVALLLSPAHAWSAERVPTPPTPDAAPATNPPIYIAFLWHMHQPIYWPYESLLVTDANARYSYSVVDIHNQRTGPYTSWPKDAVQKGINAGMGHFGAQVSLTGSLIENLNNLEAAGNGNFIGWKGNWNTAKSQSTALGNPRMDLVGFGYHHPLMGLVDYTDLRKQIQSHKTTMAANFPGAYSRGMFPPENAFTPRMIPALAAEGIEWVLIDNVHFDRAATGYPFSTAGNLYEPNGADIRNPNPNDWVQLTNLWAPTRISGAWGHRPHRVEYRDPATGAVSSIVAVPADRYMGNEDGRGGFGALLYDTVMSQLEPYNTDPAHPLLIVLHHDGDNYGGGTDSYYGSNFQAFVDWLSANPSRFVCTTVEDYLEMFPPASSDVIHVENGSWSGADNGDPEFKKWLGDPATDGYSPDRNSWAVVTAAKNFVFTAEQVNPMAAGTVNAWKYMLNAEASDYWYWDGAQDGIWDSHPTRAANQAVQVAQPVIAGQTDLTGPSIFIPQREPYNPGGTEWGIAQPSDFEVWTYVYDVSGLGSVVLKVRVDADGVLPVSSPANDTYAGGAGVGAWSSIACTASDIASRTNPLPLYRAQRYAGQITGITESLLDYYVEATDSHGNVSRSPIQHVWVGASGSSGGGGVSWLPAAPTEDNTITITVAGTTAPCKLHWGVNSFGLPIAAYRTAGTTLYNGTGPAVETPMTVSGSDLTITLGPFNDPAQGVTALDFVLHYDDGTWDNNGGSDWHVTISGGTAPTTYVMDGALDASAELVSSNAGVNLYLDWNGSQLYMASQAASGVGNDVFILVAGSPLALRSAPWAKSGQVANWAAFIGNESGNNWCGWFDQQGATAVSAGSVIEGTLDLAGELGSIPATVYVAVGRYATADGGALTAQAPAGNGDGNLDAAEWYAFPLSTTAVPGRDEARLTRFLPAAPNPFGSSALLSYELSAEAPVTLRVLDVRGREVRTLVDGREAAGLHTVRFAAGDLPPGVYFVHLRAGTVSQSQRVVLIK
jgi:hypothetical protein